LNGRRARDTFANLRAAQAGIDEEVAARYAAAEDLGEARRAEWAAASNWADDETGSVLFDRAGREARERFAEGGLDAAIPFQTENALGGLGDREDGRGFGVEIEFNFPPEMGWRERSQAKQAILRDMVNEGITQHPRWLGYYEQKRIRPTTEANGWKCTEDGTVAGELVSPIMYDEPEHWESLQKVCDIIRRHGGNATNAGGHVHVGVGDWGSSPEAHNNLLREFQVSADPIYRAGSNAEAGNHRGMSWCSPNRDIPAGGYESVQQVRNMNNSHGLGVNFESVQGRNNDHVEFRMWDQTLSPAAIQTQVRTSVAMAEAAKAGRSPADDEPRNPVGSARSRFGRRRQTGQDRKDLTRPARRLADRLFHRESDKAAFAALWAVNRNQSR
jgi:hypothetical protein